MVTETTNYTLRAANPRAADRLAVGCLPKGHIITP
jgi:hypothetical protein